MAETLIPDTITSRRRTRTYDVKDDGLQITLDAIIAFLVPEGTLIPCAQASEPAGDIWKLCNGQALLKADFPRLYAVLGGTHGETSTTFNLPDLRGRSIIGADGAVGLGVLAGSNSVTLTQAQLPAHSHPVTDPGHSHGITDPGHSHTSTVLGTNISDNGSGFQDANPGNTGTSTTGITVNSAATGISVGNTGSGDPIDITPAVIGINWLIRT